MTLPMYPRVTEILSPYTDFSMIPPEILLAAATRGTSVHHLCGAYALDIYINEIPDGQHGYVKSFKGWFNRNVKEVIAVEFEVTSAHGYIGHADFLFVMMDGQYALLDLKTPLAGSRTWFAQIAAYKRAAIESGYKVDNAGTIQPDPNGGTARVKWLSDTKENELMAFNAFLGALNAHRYFKAK